MFVPFFFVLLACILMSKFSSISPFLSAVCPCPRYSFFACSDALAVFAGRIGSITNLGACLLCFVHAFSTFVGCFSCRFCLRLFLTLLMCYLRRPCECDFYYFYVLVCFSVGVRCTSELVACFVCVCVYMC